MIPKVTPVDKEAERQAARERMRQELLEQNPSFNPSLARREVALLTPAPSVASEQLGHSPPPGLGSSTVVPESVTSIGSDGAETRMPVTSAAPPLPVAAPEPVLTSVQAVQMAPSPDQARVEAMRNFKAPLRSRKNNVRVSHRVYNRVAAYDSAHGRISKLKILSWLLYNHLPKAGKEVPRYLSKEPPEEVRECNLSFLEDASLQERFDRLEADGTPRVDIIEQIVLNNLPEADRMYRPKRRRRSWL